MVKIREWRKARFDNTLHICEERDNTTATKAGQRSPQTVCRNTKPALRRLARHDQQRKPPRTSTSGSGGSELTFAQPD